MDNVLHDMGFIKLDTFLRTKSIETDKFTSNLYLKRKEIREHKFNCVKTMTMTEIYSHCFDKINKKKNENINSDIIRDGNTKERYKENHLSNYLYQKDFFNFFSRIGDDLAIYIITDCFLVYNVDNKYVLVCGKHEDLSRNQKFPKNARIKNQNIIFKDFLMHIENLSFFSSLKFRYKLLNTETSNLDKKIRIRMKKVKYRSLFCKIFSKDLEKNEVDSENKFITNQVCTMKITRFLYTVCNKVFKSTVFTSKEMYILKKKIILFLALKKKENLKKEQLISHFKLNKIKFFKKSLIEKNAFHEKMEIFINFMLFLFDQFIMKLINVFFYCTESSFMGNKYFYYFKNFWIKESHIYIISYLKNFKQIAEKKESNVNDSKKYKFVLETKENQSYFTYKEVNKTNKLCYQDYNLIPPIRCIPKENSLRPIINLSIRKKSQRTPNEKMKQVKATMNNEISKNLGNSCLNLPTLFKKLFKFGISVKGDIFMLKVDLKGCFNNIPHARLKQMMINIFQKNEYSERILVMLSNNVFGISKKYITCAENEKVSFDKFMKERRSYFSKSKLEKTQHIIADGYCQVKQKEKLMELLKNCIFNNRIIYKHKIYIQTNGIPQGSVVSTLLCSFYFSILDKEIFDKIIIKGKIFRYVDDFLIVTPDREEISKFILESRKLKDYGVEINYDKLVANFDLCDIKKDFNTINSNPDFSENIEEKNFSKKITLSQEEEYFISQNFNYIKFKRNMKPYVDWCGLKVFSSPFSIKKSYNMSHNYTITHDNRNPGKKLKMKMKNYVIKRLEYYLVSGKNMKKYENIYDLFFYYYKRCISSFQNFDFIGNIVYIENMINLPLKMIIENIKINQSLAIDIKEKAMNDSKIDNFILLARRTVIKHKIKRKKIKLKIKLKNKLKKIKKFLDVALCL